MEKAFQGYSLEELRMSTPNANRPREVLSIRYHSGDTICGVWIPETPGVYSVQCSIDGYPVTHMLTLSVKDSDFGHPAPVAAPSTAAEEEVSNTRLFVADESAGLRIRAFPSLQSNMVGLVPTGSIITFDNVTFNGDGVWLRLSNKSTLDFCFCIEYEMEAWCMQFNRHVSKSLLHPNDNIFEEHEQKPKPAPEIGSANFMEQFKTTYVVTKNCNVRDKPKKSATIVGELQQGETIKIKQTFSTLTDTWAELCAVTVERHLFISNTGEYWVPRHSLQTVVDIEQGEDREFFPTPNTKGKNDKTTKKSRSSVAKDKLSKPWAIQFEEAKHSLNDPRSKGTIPKNTGVAGKQKKKSLQPTKYSKRLTSKNNLNADKGETIDLEVEKEEEEENVPVKPQANGDPVVAISPSKAESLRASFAAFLWHEGLVHDAMTCASYLKFHPDLPREGSEVVTRPSGHLTGSKIIQRHSVEVSNTGNNSLNIQQSTLSRRSSRRAEGAPINEEDSQESRDVVNVLPTAFRALLALWDGIAQLQPNKPKAMFYKRYETTKKPDIEDKDASQSSTDSFEGTKKLQLVSELCEEMGSEEVFRNCDKHRCELCNELVELPVTHHMMKYHEGCGRNSAGMGFNYTGIYIRGWSGPCGYANQGFMGPGYTFCEACRDKCMKVKRVVWSAYPSSPPTTPLQDTALPSFNTVAGPSTSTMSPINHLVMYKNAMFLLDLESAADSQVERISPSFPWDIPTHFNCFSDMQRIDPTQAKFTNDDAEGGEGSESMMGGRVHRSASMVQWGIAPLPDEPSQAYDSTTGSSLLCQPSAALQALVGATSTTAPSVVSRELLLSRPVISMLLQTDKDVNNIKANMLNAIRVASMRKYGLETLNWLLHTTTQSVGLHDLMWWFNKAMLENTADSESVLLQENANCDEGNAQWWCEMMSGNTLCSGVRSSLHGVLRAVSSLMPYLPPSSPLLLQAVSCWALNFSADDHHFLHRSEIFNNVSRILSHTEEDLNEEPTSMDCFEHLDLPDCQRVEVERSMDCTNWAEISVSSGLASVDALTDNSTETFWESGEDDRGRTRWIQLSCPVGLNPSSVCFHIDNARDILAKTLFINVAYGINNEETYTYPDKEISSKFSGWLVYSINGLPSHKFTIRIELRGPDNTARVRQVKVLGQMDVDHTADIKPIAVSMKKRIEMETLSVFKSITSKVFGHLVFCEDGSVNKWNDSANRPSTSSEDPSRSNEHNDLKEHMVGILFSRKKLTSLQKQVMAHIVSAISGEATRTRDAWEADIKAAETEVNQNSDQEAEITKQGDDFCFEMLSMVLALSGSRLGCSYLSEHLSLIADLITLLHCGSARVQRQVISVLSRMIREVKPQRMDQALSLPGHSKDRHEHMKETFVDHLIVCISKAVRVQVKRKSGGVSTPVRMANSMMSPTVPWYMKGTISCRLAHQLIQIFLSLITEKISQAWAQCAMMCITENVFALTKIKDEDRTTEGCMASPLLWRGLASLCVINQEQAERLNVVGWQEMKGENRPTSRPMCVNHDDGETVAIMECSECGTMCQECDRFLHLNKVTRHHHRQVCKEEQSAIRVDLHEGCGRVKLFWLLCLVEQRTLKAMVEVRGSSLIPLPNLTTGRCRFCRATGDTGLLAIGNVCAEKDCQEYSKSVCSRVHVCGHLCGGYRGETECLPCLHGCATSSATTLQDEAASLPIGRPPLLQDSDDMCMICFAEPLDAAPAIQLKCAHVFHLHCTRKVLEKRWNGPRITFTFSLCPICKEEISHPILADVLQPIKELQNEVRRKAEMRLEYEGLRDAAVIAIRYQNKAGEYAMEKYAYYVCFKCQKAYFGGEARCEADNVAEYDPKELVCGGCSDVVCAKMCKKHGADFLEYKCRYCCSVAVFFCLGDTHFCNPCHEEFQRIRKIPLHLLPNCPAAPKGKQLEGTEEDCPLRVRHPPTGIEYALGCGICRNSTTF